jgi:dTDP-glucose 4,6-dehydratase
MPTATPPDVPALLAGRRRILVTGGAGFIGGAVVRRLLTGSEAQVFNLDKCGYASDLTSIEALPQAEARHTLLQVDLTDAQATAAAIQKADPDLVLHLAAESHVDRSIEGPAAFIDSNVSGTFHLLQAVRSHWEQLPTERRRASASTTSAPMRCSAPWAPRAASRKPPPTTRAAPTRPARPPATIW